MAKVNFTKLGLKNIKEHKGLEINNVRLEVSQYLPVNEKVEFINFVVNHSLDEKTGCFSPIRVEVYFSVGLVKWYANVAFTDKQLQDIEKTYDLLESNGVFDSVTSVIPEEEVVFMKDLIRDTVADIAQYNSSFAGVITMASGEANSLDEQINKILESVRNREGLEVLGAVKDMVGKD